MDSQKPESNASQVSSNLLSSSILQNNTFRVCCEVPCASTNARFYDTANEAEASKHAACAHFMTAQDFERLGNRNRFPLILFENYIKDDLPADIRNMVQSYQQASLQEQHARIDEHFDQLLAGLTESINRARAKAKQNLDSRWQQAKECIEEMDVYNKYKKHFGLIKLQQCKINNARQQLAHNNSQAQRAFAEVQALAEKRNEELFLPLRDSLLALPDVTADARHAQSLSGIALKCIDRVGAEFLNENVDLRIEPRNQLGALNAQYDAFQRVARFGVAENDSAGYIQTESLHASHNYFLQVKSLPNADYARVRIALAVAGHDQDGAGNAPANAELALTPPLSEFISKKDSKFLILRVWGITNQNRAVRVSVSDESLEKYQDLQLPAEAITNPAARFNIVFFGQGRVDLKILRAQQVQ